LSFEKRIWLTLPELSVADTVSATVDVPVTAAPSAIVSVPLGGVVSPPPGGAMWPSVQLTPPVRAIVRPAPE
jgi:hypothetical protein